MTEVFRAAWIVPVDRAPIPDGELAVRAGRIVGLGPRGSQSGDALRDLGGAILVPGFINAHAHLELTCYAAKLPPSSLWDWIARLVELRSAPGALDRERQAVADGAAMSLAAGVTCVADISREGIHVEPLAASPIRKVCYVELISGAARPPNDPETLRRTLDALSQFSEPGRLDLGVAPHAPYTVEPDHLTATIALAAARHLPWTLHLLETRDEADWRAGRPTAIADFLRTMGVPASAVAARAKNIDKFLHQEAPGHTLLFAHVNYPDGPTIERLAKTRGAVAWCPRAHAYFRHPPHPWRRLQAAGVNVCVGTDSLASNDSLSILDELRHVRRTHPEVPVAEILRLGTLNAAQAIGRADGIGSLSPGKRADFVALLPGSQGTAAPKALFQALVDPVSAILDNSVSVEGVWIDGRPAHGK